MRARAEIMVLDEPVRPDAPTGLTAQTGLTGPETGLTGPETGLTSQTAENGKSAIAVNSKGKAKVADWRLPCVTYLKDHGHGVERNILCLAFKYILIDDEFIVEPPKMYFLSVWILIRPVCLWGKFMKASVVHTNRLLK